MRSRDSKRHFQPNYKQNGHELISKTMVIKKRFLVFNDGGDHKLIAILRISNPIANSDVFYKLSSDGCKPCIQVRSWKGRVRQNSHVDVTIVAYVRPEEMEEEEEDEEEWSDDQNGEQHYNNHNKRQQQHPPADVDLTDISLAKLCQTQFLLEMSEYVPRWRPAMGPKLPPSLASMPNIASTRDEHNLFIKADLYCITAHMLHRIETHSMLDVSNLSWFTHSEIRQLIDSHMDGNDSHTKMFVPNADDIDEKQSSYKSLSEMDDDENNCDNISLPPTPAGAAINITCFDDDDDKEKEEVDSDIEFRSINDSEHEFEQLSDSVELSEREAIEPHEPNLMNQFGMTPSDIVVENGDGQCNGRTMPTDNSSRNKNSNVFHNILLWFRMVLLLQWTLLGNVFSNSYNFCRRMSHRAIDWLMGNRSIHSNSNSKQSVECE